MASFQVEVVRVEVEEHPNADRLELLRVGGYRVLARKGSFKTGDLAAYIPESAVVPDGILREMGLEGKLSGPKKNRVTARRFRGVLSQGLCYPARRGWVEGQDVTEELGIIKYEPPVPISMGGQVYNGGPSRTVKYDIENYKRFPDILEEGEPVIITEKIHGTFVCIGILSGDDIHPEYGMLAVSSKGLGARGQVFKPAAEENKNNLYLGVAKKIIGDNPYLAFKDRTIFILGEIFGSGVQDLSYGYHSKTDGEIGFRFFDIVTVEDGERVYLSDDELETVASTYDLERVPVLYRGPFSEEILKELTDGKETVSGAEKHIREGVVVRPLVERQDDRIGRVQLKSVSEAYLTRRGGTEYT